MPGNLIYLPPQPFASYFQFEFYKLSLQDKHTVKITSRLKTKKYKVQLLFIYTTHEIKSFPSYSLIFPFLNVVNSMFLTALELLGFISVYYAYKIF